MIGATEGLFAKNRLMGLCIICEYNYMRIGEASGSYGMYPFMTRVSVGDRPVTALVSSPAPREVSENDDIQPYNIPNYSRNGRVEDSTEPPGVENRAARSISVVA